MLIKYLITTPVLITYTNPNSSITGSSCPLWQKFATSYLAAKLLNKPRSAHLGTILTWTWFSSQIGEAGFLAAPGEVKSLHMRNKLVRQLSLRYVANQLCIHKTGNKDVHVWAHIHTHTHIEDRKCIYQWMTRTRSPQGIVCYEMWQDSVKSISQTLEWNDWSTNMDLPPTTHTIKHIIKWR